MRLSSAAVIAISMIVGCTRRAPDAPADAAPVDAAPAPAPADAASPVDAVDNVDAARSESSSKRRPEMPESITSATRQPLESFTKEPSLAPHAAVLKAHFGGPTALVAQRADLADHATAWLLSAPGKDSRPIVLVVGPAHELLWTKERPVAGIEPPVGDVTIAPRRDGGLALFACDPPTRLVAGRMWTADGGPFADYHVMDIEECEAIAALYWPGAGWLVVASSPDGARAQLLRDAGTLAWPQSGLDVAQWARESTARHAVERARLARLPSGKVRILAHDRSVDLTPEGDVQRNN